MMDQARIGLRDAWTQLRAKFTVRLGGTKGRWQREFLPQPGGRVQLTLRYRGTIADRRTAQLRRECRCIVHDPRGVRYYSTHVDGGGSEWYLIYPDDFAYPGSARQRLVATRLGLDVRPPPKVTGGVYRVSWHERTSSHSEPGSWRLMDVGQFQGTDAT